uniref:Uncharacterized protein n=1 Tax=Solanum tuberosum TaxID=4113 RepID=M1DA01_SOLTU
MESSFVRGHSKAFVELELAFEASIASLRIFGKDQVNGKREQSAHRREVPRSSTMSPNDLEHDDVEGWCKTAMNYTKGRITELIGDSDKLRRVIR